MSKHQRGNKEAKKPKKAPGSAVPSPVVEVQPGKDGAPASRARK